MNRTEILERLFSIVREKEIPAGVALDEGTHVFEGGLALDSFAAVELIARIEEALDMQFDDADFEPEHFTLGALADVVSMRRREAEARR